LPRSPAGSVGYEDIRIFRTDQNGLQGIAASLHLKRSDRRRKPLAEQVLLSFDDQYDIVDAQPIRDGSWSEDPQKNWVPFDHCSEPRFLYAIDKGILFDDRGELDLSDAVVRPSSRARRMYAPDDEARDRAIERADEAEQSRSHEDRRRDRRDGTRLRHASMELEQPSCDGLRGGSQLVRVGDGTWLGIGHAMRFVDKLKYYWHVWYLVDARGKVTSASLPMKLAPNGIEFAAGMAIDGDRVVVSFGVDDMECRIGETSLSAVMGALRPLVRFSIGKTSAR